MPFKVDIPFSLEDLEEVLKTEQYFYDDFVGALLDERWSLGGTAGWSRVLGNSLIELSTKAENNAFADLNWNGKTAYSYREQPKMLATVLPDTNTDIKHYVGLYLNSDNYMMFEHTATNWWATCRSGGTPTSVDTGIALATNLTNLRIDVISGSEVNFYIDDVIGASIATNISTDYLQPRFTVQSAAAAIKKFSIDKILVRANRYTP